MTCGWIRQGCIIVLVTKMWPTGGIWSVTMDMGRPWQPHAVYGMLAARANANADVVLRFLSLSQSCGGRFRHQRDDMQVD